jgi:hypothetical protein
MEFSPSAPLSLAIYLWLRRHVQSTRVYSSKLFTELNLPLKFINCIKARTFKKNAVKNFMLDNIMLD